MHHFFPFFFFIIIIFFYSVLLGRCSFLALMASQRNTSECDINAVPVPRKRHFSTLKDDEVARYEAKYIQSHMNLPIEQRTAPAVLSLKDLEAPTAMPKLACERDAIEESRAYNDQIPWWKRILFDLDYRAAMILEATKCYDEELALLEHTPEQISSSYGKSSEAVMSQYVVVRAAADQASSSAPGHAPFSHRHPNLIIKHSKLDSLRRIALDSMPPAQTESHLTVQKEAIEDYLAHHRRTSLTRSRRGKRVEAKRILLGRAAIPPLAIQEVSEMVAPVVSEAGKPENFPPCAQLLSPLTELREILETAQRNREEEKEERRQRGEEVETEIIPSRMLGPSLSKNHLNQIKKKSNGAWLTTFGSSAAGQQQLSAHEPRETERQRLEAFSAAKACVDGLDNLYGLSYFWDEPLPPSGFIRIAPDPRHAMWPDDFRESAHRIELEKKKLNMKRKIQRVNEQNKKKRFYLELGIRVNPLMLFEPNAHSDPEAGEEEVVVEEIEEAQKIRQKVLEDGVLKPLYTGPLNINIYVEVYKKELEKRKQVDRGPIGEPAASPRAGAPPPKPTLAFAGTFRQSLLLIHYKNYARALHREEDQRVKGKLAHLGGQLDDAATVERRLEHHKLYSKRLRGVPRFSFPVLRVQSEAPPLRQKFAFSSVDITQIHPAACWEGLCPFPSGSTEEAAWRHLQRTSLLSRQVLQDIFQSLPLNPDGRLEKLPYIDFVLDLLHLFFPTYRHDLHIAIAEEEWVFRGTTEAVEFPTFFQKFFSFPFIFMREMEEVHEQQYVEFWSLVRVCLFENAETTPTLVPFSIQDRDYSAEGTYTSSQPLEVMKQAKPRIQWRHEGSALARYVVMRPVNTKAEAEEGSALEQQHSARTMSPVASPPYPTSRKGSKAQANSARVAFGNTYAFPTESEPPTAAPSPEAPDQKALTGGSSTGGPHAPSSRHGRGSLLVPFMDVTPREIRQLYTAEFRHPHDYDLVLMTRHIAASDPQVQLLPASHREVVIRSRAARLLAEAKEEAEREEEAHFSTLEKRQKDDAAARKAERLGQPFSASFGVATLTLTMNDTIHKTHLHAVRQEVAMEMALVKKAKELQLRRTTDYCRSGSEQSGEAMSRGSSRSSSIFGEGRREWILRRELQRKKVLERLEQEREKAQRLLTCNRFFDRRRGIHGRAAKVISGVENIGSAWELHYDDVYELVERPKDIEDHLLDYVADVDLEMFDSPLSLRERYLVHEDFKRERERLRFSGRNRPIMQEKEPPRPSVVQKVFGAALAEHSQWEESEAVQLALDPYRRTVERKKAATDETGPLNLPYPPRKLSMAPLMDPSVLKHMYALAMASNPSGPDAINRSLRGLPGQPLESYASGAYPLHPTEGKKPTVQSPCAGSHSPLFVCPSPPSPLDSPPVEEWAGSEFVSPMADARRLEAGSPGLHSFFHPNAGASQYTLPEKPRGSRGAPSAISGAFIPHTKVVRSKFGGIHADGPEALQHLHALRLKHAGAASGAPTFGTAPSSFPTEEFASFSHPPHLSLTLPTYEPKLNASLSHTGGRVPALGRTVHWQNSSELDASLEDSIAGSIQLVPGPGKCKINGITETVAVKLRELHREAPAPSPIHASGRDHAPGSTAVYSLEPSPPRFEMKPIPYSRELLRAYQSTAAPAGTAEMEEYGDDSEELMNLDSPSPSIFQRGFKSSVFSPSSKVLAGEGNVPPEAASAMFMSESKFVVCGSPNKHGGQREYSQLARSVLSEVEREEGLPNGRAPVSKLEGGTSSLWTSEGKLATLGPSLARLSSVTSSTSAPEAERYSDRMRCELYSTLGLSLLAPSPLPSPTNATPDRPQSPRWAAPSRQKKASPRSSYRLSWTTTSEKYESDGRAAGTTPPVDLETVPTSVQLGPNAAGVSPSTTSKDQLAPSRVPPPIRDLLHVSLIMAEEAAGGLSPSRASARTSSIHSRRASKSQHSDGPQEAHPATLLRSTKKCSNEGTAPRLTPPPPEKPMIGETADDLSLRVKNMGKWHKAFRRQLQPMQTLQTSARLGRENLWVRLSRQSERAANGR